MNFKAFVDSLQYMGLGLAGIFVVILVIYAVIVALNASGNIGKKKEQ